MRMTISNTPQQYTATIGQGLQAAKENTVDKLGSVLDSMDIILDSIRLLGSTVDMLTGAVQDTDRADDGTKHPQTPQHFTYIWANMPDFLDMCSAEVIKCLDQLKLSITDLADVPVSSGAVLMPQKNPEKGPFDRIYLSMNKLEAAVCLLKEFESEIKSSPQEKIETQALLHNNFEMIWNQLPSFLRVSASQIEKFNIEIKKIIYG